MKDRAFYDKSMTIGTFNKTFEDQCHVRNEL